MKSFVRDASGAGLGAKVSWLKETPVSDFFLPGLFLLGVYGIGSVMVLLALMPSVRRFYTSGESGEDIG